MIFKTLITPFITGYSNSKKMRLELIRQGASGTSKKQSCRNTIWVQKYFK